MIEINKYELSTTGIDACKGKLVPGIVATWGEIIGDVTKQEDLIEWVEGQGYLTEHQPIKTVNHQSLIGEGDIEIEAVVPDYYATKQWVQDQGYLTEHQSLEGYATESWVSGQGYLVESDLSQYATRQWVVGRGYITSEALTGYATESWVSSQGYLTSVPSGYATEQWVGQQGYITTSALSGYATESWVSSQGYASESDLTSLTSRVSTLEEDYGDAVTTTNNILGV